MTRAAQLYGLLAEFDSPTALVEATRRMRAAGHDRLETSTPFPIKELDEVLGLRRSPLPLITLVGGVIGCLGGFFMQYYAAVLSYPLNIGGRPLNSWPAFVPLTFELAVLVAAVSAVFGMLLLSGLPRPFHPVFTVQRFGRASQDRFFLCVEARDPQFDRVGTRKLLESLHAVGVYDVES
jgi:hypothetical protein